MKKKLLIFLLFGFFINALANESMITCTNIKTQLIDLKTNKVGKFEIDASLKKIDLLVKNDKVYLFANIGVTELIPISKSAGSTLQFLERLDQQSILYTYFLYDNTLTIQKSYDFLGAIMVNMYSNDCKVKLIE